MVETHQFGSLSHELIYQKLAQMKKQLTDLAIFGGAPAFPEKLHVGAPNIGSRERLLERFNRVLDNRWLTNHGPFVKEFEQRIAELTGARHCVAMCNATTALEIAIRALGLTGEVIVPSFTFIATAHVLQWQNLTPVFCDIDPATHCIDARRIEELITPRTSGILGVHLWGNACDVDSLSEIAGRHKLKLLFDAAHAFNCSHQGRMIGNFGDAEVFSFHATKFFNTLEGGAFVTNNDELARKVRLMKDFGFTNFDEVSLMGINGKMNEVSAAVGLTNLESLDEFVSVNKRNYDEYRKYLAGVKGIKVLSYDSKDKRNYQYVVIEIDESKTFVTRDQILNILHAENILARRYFSPGCHRMEPYRSLYPNAHLSLPKTERVGERVMTLPTGQMIVPESIQTICEIISTAVERAAEIRDMFRGQSAVS